MEFNTYSEEGREQFGNRFLKQNTAIIALQSFLTGKELEGGAASLARQFKCVQDFLDASPNSPQEQVLKKVFAKAIVVAKEKGVLPFSIPDYSPERVASIVDQGLDKIKMAYNVGRGVVDKLEAEEKTMNKQVARVMTVVDKAVEAGVSVAVNAVTEVIEKVYPPAKAITPIVKAVQPFIAERTKTFVRKGMEKIVSTARSTCKTVFSAVKNTVTSFGARIRTLFA